jgi:hypothetical protein
VDLRVALDDVKKRKLLTLLGLELLPFGRRARSQCLRHMFYIMITGRIAHFLQVTSSISTSVSHCAVAKTLKNDTQIKQFRFNLKFTLISRGPHTVV